MSRLDEVALRCPNCGSVAAGRVPHEERMQGTATVTCLICKKTVSVPVPLPFPQSVIQDTLRTLRLYGFALKEIGWAKTLFLLAVWVGGAYFITSELGWPYWLAILIPSLPFLYFFTRALAPRMRAQLRSELGVLRVPGGYKGMSERDPILVRAPAEVDKTINARPCPVCSGKFQILERRLVLPKSSMEQMKFRLTKKAGKMFEKVEVKCRKCSNQGSFFFDISNYEIVRRLGYTDELIKQYSKNKK